MRREETGRMKLTKLQNIIFPAHKRFIPYTKMFYYGEGMEQSADKEYWGIAEYHAVDFAAYFNSFSIKKWMKYTKIDNVKICLTMKGSFKIRISGYYMNRGPFQEEVLSEQSFDLDEKKELILDIPQVSDQVTIVGFQIVGYKNCCLYSGYYATEIAEEEKREVRLALATTTFKKEDFILPNIQLLKDEILNSEDEMAKNFYVHVIDNGRTLNKEELECDHLWIHPNPNTGGSGGFSRGIIEANLQEKPATHVLLMDDDVIILPESLKRTYRLLTLLKEEYKDHFISGAMLYYERMNEQHEDIGYVHDDGSYGPLKHRLDMQRLDAVVRNEEPWPKRKNQYAGWWYCCIPTTIARLDNLPLPLFVRGDDVEYSLRNHAKFITMNSICVWHMGFTLKFNAAMELYQVHRNSLAIQAASGICQNIDFAERMRKFTRVELLRFNYNSAELLMDAVDDYLKGPAFFEKPDGERILKEKGAKNEKFEPLSKFKNIPVDLDAVYGDGPRGRMEKLIYRLTFNGLFCPDFLLKKEPVVIAYDWFYAPHRQYLRKKLLAVNPHMQTGAIRTLDKKRGKALLKRYRKTFKEIEQRQKNIRKKYQDRRAYMTSYEFWKKYLGI